MKSPVSSSRWATYALVFLPFVLALGAKLLWAPDPLFKTLQNSLKEQRIADLESRLDQERRENAVDLERLRSELEEQKTLELKSPEIGRLNQDLAKLGIRRRGAERRWRALQSETANLQQRLREENESASSLLAQLEQTRQDLRHARMEVESVLELEALSERDLQTLQAPRLEAQQAYEHLLQNEQLLLAELERWQARRPKPTEIEVLEYPRIWPDGLQRRDRCISCHLGMAEDLGTAGPEEPVFAPHPRIDLFVGTDSPHPIESFGCTVCHGGEGLATEFASAGHLPRDDDQAAAWTDRGWTWNPENTAPILSRTSTQASCTGCHFNGAPDGAEHLRRGRERWQDLGCNGCHNLDSSLAPRSIGLDRIAAKTNPIWTYHWIATPRTFDSFARMPHLFDLEQTQGEEKVRQELEIRSIVNWLWQRSQPLEIASLNSKRGNARDGEELFGSVGCRACHTLDASPTEPSFGPNLFGLGSKVSRDWLVTWLLDPRSYHPQARMPDLRLNSQEVADLAAYLLASQYSLELSPLPETDERVRDELILAHLEQETTLEESQARLARMKADEKELFLGERSFDRYGCGGCHAGADLPKDIEAPLSNGRMGEKGRLDHVEEAISWPHSAGEHLQVPPMPHYDLRDEDQELLSIVLLAQQTPRLRQAPTHSQGLALERGRALIARNGCDQCHRIENSATPWEAPDLSDYGKRIQPGWLLGYLRDPKPLRPGRQLRMPSFTLSEEERRDLAAYFAALSDVPLWVEEKPTNRLDAAVGSVVYGILQCASCHLENQPGSPPSYRQARDRLRPSWVVSWILDPKAFDPQTAMPTILAYEAQQNADSFLSRAIGAPMYWLERGRLQRFFKSEQAMTEYLSDAEQLAEALRAHLWTLTPGDEG